MPDQIGDYYVLNKLQPPSAHGWKLNKITREYVDGDAWQRIARRALETTHACTFYAQSAVDAGNFVVALYAMEGTAGVTMVCDGNTYEEIVIIAVRNITVQPLQRHSTTFDYNGAAIAGGVGGRLVSATFIVGRSNQPVDA